MPGVSMGTGVVATDSMTADAIATALGYTPAQVPIVTNVTPTTGQTVSFTDDNKDRTLWLTPAGTLATLTVTFPSEANSRIGQIVRIGSSQNITALTLNGASSILNPVTTLLQNNTVAFQKVAANTWIRIL